MTTFSLRVGKSEERLFREYAKIHHVSVSELLRNAAIEKITDEIDLSLFEKAITAMSATYTLSEVKKELGLE